MMLVQLTCAMQIDFWLVKIDLRSTNESLTDAYDFCFTLTKQSHRLFDW